MQILIDGEQILGIYGRPTPNALTYHEASLFRPSIPATHNPHERDRDAIDIAWFT